MSNQADRHIRANPHGSQHNANPARVDPATTLAL
jgi:hypothetical protein